jgi:hypothetical protein
MQLRDIGEFMTGAIALVNPGSCEFSPHMIVAIEVQPELSMIRLHFHASTIDLEFNTRDGVALYMVKNAILSAARGEDRRPPGQLFRQWMHGKGEGNVVHLAETILSQASTPPAAPAEERGTSSSIPGMEKLEKQKREFDAFAELSKAYEQLPAIVDDDYPDARERYELMLHRFLVRCKENGRMLPP